MNNEAMLCISTFRIYNIEQRQINVVYFNVDMNNIIQRRNNVVLFNVKFQNVGQRQNNVVKMGISQNKKKESYQIEYTEFKILTDIS